MAMSDGIQPASASTKTRGTPESAGASGNRLKVSKRTPGRTTNAARSVERASRSTTILIAASSALKRPNHSSEMKPMYLRAAVIGIEAVDPIAKRSRYAVKRTMAAWVNTAVDRMTAK